MVVTPSYHLKAAPFVFKNIHSFLPLASGRPAGQRASGPRHRGWLRMSTRDQLFSLLKSPQNGFQRLHFLPLQKITIKIKSQSRHHICPHMHTFTVVFAEGAVPRCSLHRPELEQTFNSTTLIFPIAGLTGCVRHCGIRHPGQTTASPIVPVNVDGLGTRMSGCFVRFSVHQRDVAAGFNVPSVVHSRCNRWPKAPICADPLT